MWESDFPMLDISDHAVVRYLERHLKFPVDSTRRFIGAKKNVPMNEVRDNDIVDYFKVAMPMLVKRIQNDLRNAVDPRIMDFSDGKLVEINHKGMQFVIRNGVMLTVIEE